MSGLAEPPLDFTILDALDSGVVVLDQDHRVVHWNEWMASASGLAAADLAGRPVWGPFPHLASSRLHDAVEDALSSGLPSHITAALHGRIFPLTGRDGRPVFHNVVVRRLERHGTILCLIQVHDVTARWEAEQALRRSDLRVRNQLAELEAVYRTAPIGLGLFDRNMTFLRINEALADMNGLPVADHLGRNAWEVVPSLRPVAGPLFQRAIETGEAVRGIELWGTTPRQPGVERCWIEDFYPLKDVDGEVFGVGVMVREVTEQKRLEERARLLNAELGHRIKNLFAMIGALMHQTARGATSLDDFVARFGGRIDAMAAAQNLLTEVPSGAAVALSALVTTALAPFSAEAGRFRFALGDTGIAAGIAGDLALALHELATNATKYGALSRPGGHVAVTGRIEGADGRRRLHLDWQESGGPAVTAPARKGFGTRLLERTITTRPGAEVAMDWQPGGLLCRITVPDAG